MGNWFSQAMTLWFNVVNHLPHEDDVHSGQNGSKHGPQQNQQKKCMASDKHLPQAPNLFFGIMNQFMYCQQAA